MLTEQQYRRKCKINVIYEVVCDAETCNGMQDEIHQRREDAIQAREEHIQLHLDGQFDAGPNSESSPSAQGMWPQFRAST